MSVAGTHPASAPGSRTRGKSVRPLAARVLVYLVLILGAVLAVAPFLWMVSTSFKELQNIGDIPPEWFPNPFVTHNYPDVWNELPMLRFFTNSTYITVLSVIGQLIFCSTSAYAFARLEFTGRDKLFYLYLATMMIPGQVTLIPSFVLMRWLGWIDTPQALIVPGLGSAFGIFLLRQYFLTIPRELEDAAKIDGYGLFGIYWHVILPLSKAALAALAVFAFLGSWNDFLWPFVVINTPERMTLPVGLSFLSANYATEWTKLMAGSTLSLIPTILIFLLAQRYFIEGITVTGLKG
jgi:multiple sugar transport system permease protein